MLSKNIVKYIQSLCHKKQRNEEGLFIAEGTKIVEELLNSNYEVQQIFATEDWVLNTTYDFTNTKEISEDELKKISSLQTPNNVLAIVKQKENYFPKPNNKLNLVLDTIQDPGNLGTIIRIADWFGIENIYCSGNTADLYNSKVIQSTMGSFARVNVWYGNLVNEVFEKYNLPVLGAVLDGKNLKTFNKINEGFLVIGNEGKGISKHVLQYVTEPVTIEKKGNAESLNAAIATGILLSHLT